MVIRRQYDAPAGATDATERAGLLLQLVGQVAQGADSPGAVSAGGGQQPAQITDGWSSHQP